jgi:Zn-dependent peptidase ImmA (M78 family)
MNRATRRKIDNVTWQTLRDAGITQPPVSVEVLVEHLQLYRHFYDLRSPGFLDRLKHRIMVHGRKLIEIVRKINLQAVLLYDDDRIVVDEGLAKIKHDFATCHELAHRVFEWHKPFFDYGDTAQTLHPDYHEILEAEANSGASAFMFCGPVFTREALDTIPAWSSVLEMQKRYKKSLTATLRRYVEHGPNCAMAMLVSTPSWKDKPKDQPQRWRHFARSELFRSHFGRVSADDLLAAIDGNIYRRGGGLVADFSCDLEDDNGTSREFRGQTFNNTYYLLTIFVQMRRRSAKRVVVPSVF